MDQVEATQTLNNASFKVQKTSQPSATVPAGSVIATNPPVGSSAPHGATVTIVVSTGPEQVTVPNVTTPSNPMTQAQATSALTAAGLDVRVVMIPSSAPNNGKVITQSPVAGTTVSKGATVTITVGTGPGATTTTTSTP